MMQKKPDLEIKKTLLCTRCNTTIFEGDAMAGTKIVKCPSCVAAELGLTMQPEVNERIDELDGKYALNMDLHVKGFPVFHMSIGETQLRKYLDAIKKHRETGEATLDKWNGEEV